MTLLVYRGNTSFEEVGDATAVTVGTRRATVPASLVSAHDLRATALALREARPASTLPRSAALHVLDRLGALAHVRHARDDLPGWEYLLRHAPDPELAVSRLEGWTVDERAHGASAGVEDLALLCERLRMFGPWSSGRRVAVVLVDPHVTVLTDEVLAADLCLVVDPRVGRGQPATVTVSRDPRRALEHRRLERGSRRPGTGLRRIDEGTPLRRLLFSLAAVLVVDEVTGTHRLLDTYEVSDDLTVANVRSPGWSAPRALGHPLEPEARTDAEVVDLIVRTGAVDRRLRGDLDARMEDGRPHTVCRWLLTGRPRSVRATGPTAGAASVRAVALAVATSFRLLGHGRVRVEVGSAVVEHGDDTGSDDLVPLDTEALLGTAAVRVLVPAASLRTVGPS